MASKRGPLLTKQRKAYSNSRKAGNLRGLPLQYSAPVQERYKAKLDALVKQMTDTVDEEVRRLFEGGTAGEFFATEDASISSQARILVNSLSKRFNGLFASKAKPYAEAMVKSADVASSTAMHSSLSKLSGGMSLKTVPITGGLEDIYKATISSNVSLIKSIASQYLPKVEGAVMRSITTGNGLKDLLPALQQYKGQTERRATNIALDQTRKAYNGINRGRMTAIGVQKFMWHHSGGGAHPRPDHVAMDGNIYSFDDLPVVDENTGERGIPGDAINCRCTMSPVFSWSEDE